MRETCQIMFAAVMDGLLRHLNCRKALKVSVEVLEVRNQIGKVKNLFGDGHSLHLVVCADRSVSVYYRLSCVTHCQSQQHHAAGRAFAIDGVSEVNLLVLHTLDGFEKGSWEVVKGRSLRDLQRAKVV